MNCEALDTATSYRLAQSFRWAAAAALLLSVGGCAATPKIGPDGLPEKIFSLPTLSRTCPVRSPSEIASGVDGLNAQIGSFPPRFRDEAERDETYALWSDLVVDASAPCLEVNDEMRLFLLAELYRQGHNMDVPGSAERAESTIEQCVSTYPRFPPCHFSASYFYLSVIPNPTRLQRARRSLDVLRSEARPQPNAEAESGYVFLHIYEGDLGAAVEQIDFFLTAFPDSPRADGFRKIAEAYRARLAAGETTIEVKEVKEWPSDAKRGW